MFECELQKDMKQKTATEANDIKSSCKRRSFVTPIVSNQITYCFCRETDAKENLMAAGTLHASKTETVVTHVKKLTETWTEMASCFEDEYLLVILAYGDTTLNELFYQKSNVKCCYQKCRKRYLKRLNEIKSNYEQNSEGWLKTYSWNKIIYFMKYKENKNPGIVFEVKLLKKNYKIFHNIYVESHVTRFSKVIKERIPGLEICNVGKKVT